MGQYYKVILLAENADSESEPDASPGASPDASPDANPEVIRLAICPHAYRSGAKLMEHSYVRNPLVNLVEYLISRQGPFYKSRIVWAGDYADSEGGDVMRNLYHVAEEREDWLMFSLPKGFDNSALRYIVNHTTKQYIDKAKCKEDQHGLAIHPLPLLVSEGNGCGGGDYCGQNENVCGQWSRDYISMETKIPSGFTELETDFAE